MIDINFLRANPEKVKENIRKKFQDQKLPMVDEVIELDAKRRAIIRENDELKAQRNALSKANGPLYGKLKKAADDEKAAIQAQIDANTEAVKANADRQAALDAELADVEAEIRKRMLVIPNIIDDSVPIGKDDSQNV